MALAFALTIDRPLGVSGVSEAVRPALVQYWKGIDASHQDDM
jgi:hypothetical protein